MKIGFSLGRCVDSIAKGEVDYDDVLVIISRTNIHKPEIFEAVMREYSYEHYISSPVEVCAEIAARLYKEGKIHQPRQFNAPVPRVEFKDIWMDLVPTNISDNESVRQAWNNYQVMLRLVSDNKATTPDHIPALKQALDSRRSYEAENQKLPNINDNF